jgi:hypothetical protein
MISVTLAPLAPYSHNLKHYYEYPANTVEIYGVYHPDISPLYGDQCRYKV